MIKENIMTDKEIKAYKMLNEIAEPNGIVIFGGSDEKNIPLCELKQAFWKNANIYNRSISNLSVDNAEEVYTACIAKLCPETILLHIGAADLGAYSADPCAFEQKYTSLIRHIKKDSKNCNVAVVSLKNNENNADIAKLNKTLKNIADSERCEFCDISAKRVWNPKQTKEVTSFVYDLGFVRPLKLKRSVNDLFKPLFCYECNF